MTQLKEEMLTDNGNVEGGKIDNTKGKFEFAEALLVFVWDNIYF